MWVCFTSYRNILVQSQSEPQSSFFSEAEPKGFYGKRDLHQISSGIYLSGRVDECQQIPAEQKVLPNQPEFTKDLMREEAESSGHMPQVKDNSGLYKGKETAQAVSGEEEWHLRAAGSSWDDRHRGSIRGFAVIQPLQE